MRIKNLLYALLALPLVFAACEDNKVDEVKSATVEVVAGAVTENSVTFTVTTTEATKAAWFVVKASDTTPSATEIFAAGKEIAVNSAVEVTATDLVADTEYYVVAAAMNSKGAVKKEIKMTTAKGTGEPGDKEYDVEFVATQIKTDYFIEDGANFYSVELGDKGWQESGWGVDGGTYYSFIIVPSANGNGVLPNGTYSLSTVVEPNTIVSELSYHYKMANGVPEGDLKLYKAATLVISDGKVEATVEFEDGTTHRAVFEGDLSVDDGGSQSTIEFTATVADIKYYGTDASFAYNYYVVLSNVGLNENGNYKENGIYYLLDLYAADSELNNDYTVPNGKYKAASTLDAGTFSLGDYGACIVMVEGVPTYAMYADGTIEITDGKIEANFVMEDGAEHHVVFEGNLKYGGEDPVGPNVQSFTADKWVWGDASSYGNKYDVEGEGFELDVHFPAEYATAEGLAAGEYIWTNTSWWGYNEFENEFTTREFYVLHDDGVWAYASTIRSGKALVEKDGEEYHIQLTLNADDAAYMIEYTGKITMPTVGGEENETINFTSMSEGEAQGDYNLKYALKDESGENKATLVLEKSLADVASITAGTYSWVSSPSNIYGANFSFMNKTLYIAGTQYANNQISAGTCTVAVEGGVYTITINITVLDVEKTFVYVGTIGEGGETPAEPVKLATPSVTGLADGNVATVSWQVVEGAKDYTVTLNGTDVQTVATAYVVYNNLAYSTTYNVSVVANPEDATVNCASDAGTATFTTDADPNAGGGEEPEQPGDGGESYENWVFSASLSSFMNGTLTLTDGTRTVTCKFNNLAATIPAGDTSAYAYAYDFTVDGVAVDIANVSGNIYLDMSAYFISIDLVIDGVKYTGTSTNAVA